MSNRVHVTFGMRGDTLDPQSVTDHLGISPAHAFRQGDSYPTRDGRILERPFGVWQVRSEDVVGSDDLEDHASYILGQIEPARDRLAQYLEDESVYVDVRIWYETESETGGYTLSSSTMTRLARISKVINFTYILEREDD